MSEPRHTKEELRYMQSLPLDLKIRLTEDRIRAWVGKYGEDGVCVSFSGGKDSTVLLDIVRRLYPDVRAVFSNTGLEYPEIRQFAMKHGNVDIVYPEMRFKDVITQYGYPLISKEVAEAIYYARRIGGGTHKEETPRVLSSTRRETKSNPNGGGYHEVRRAALQGSLPPKIPTSTEGGGMGELPQKMSASKPQQSSGQKMLLQRESQRRRNDFHGKWQDGTLRQELKGTLRGSTIVQERDEDTNCEDSKPG